MANISISMMVHANTVTQTQPMMSTFLYVDKIVQLIINLTTNQRNVSLFQAPATTCSTITVLHTFAWINLSVQFSNTISSKLINVLTSLTEHRKMPKT